MLQQPAPDDYIVATGESHSAREFLDVAFAAVGLDWHDYVKIDVRYDRRSEVDHLRGDASKALAAFGWKPPVSFTELVELMVAADCEKAERERQSPQSRVATIGRAVQ